MNRNLMLILLNCWSITAAFGQGPQGLDFTENNIKDYKTINIHGGGCYDIPQTQYQFCKNGMIFITQPQEFLVLDNSLAARLPGEITVDTTLTIKHKITGKEYYIASDKTLEAARVICGFITLTVYDSNREVHYKFLTPVASNNNSRSRSVFPSREYVSLQQVDGYIQILELGRSTDSFIKEVQCANRTLVK